MGPSGDIDMLNCKEVVEVCSAELDRSLKLSEQLKLRTHLVMCTGCTQSRKQLKTLRQVMQAYAHGLGSADPDRQD
jgi:hypothetical protein